MTARVFPSGASAARASGETKATATTAARRRPEPWIMASPRVRSIAPFPVRRRSFRTALSLGRPARGALSPVEDDPGEKERRQDPDVHGGLADVLLDPQQEVQNRQRAGEIGQPVQTLPARVSKAPDGRGGRGCGQRN